MPAPERPLPPYMVHDRRLQTRRRALRTLLVSGPITLAAAVFAVFAAEWLRGTRFAHLLRGELLVLLAVPMVPFLLALASWLTSQSREELEASWNGLRGWQRGVLGLLIVAAASAVILGGVALVLQRVVAR